MKFKKKTKTIFDKKYFNYINLYHSSFDKIKVFSRLTHAKNIRSKTQPHQVIVDQKTLNLFFFKSHKKLRSETKGRVSLRPFPNNLD